MSQDSLPPRLEKPQWQWLPRLLELVPFLLGFVLLFFPTLIDSWVRWPIGVVLMSAPVSVPALIWLCKAGRVAFQRVRHYSCLYEYAQSTGADLTQAQRRIYGFLQRQVETRASEITGACHRDGKLYITLKKHRGRRLAKGDSLLVLDNEDGKLMGEFEVTEVRADEYYAVGVNAVDPVWLGRVRQQGETRMLPGMVAIQPYKDD
jgi:hypothetical protein